MVKKLEREISQDFIAALAELAARKDTWWGEIVRDKTLIIAVRGGYLNVYWRGQSIFRVGWSSGCITASTHSKYLLNPTLKGQIPLNVETGGFEPLPPGAFMSNYKAGESLARLKKAAGIYAGDEKRGVHEIVMANSNVVDVEIALTDDESEKSSALRLDIATFNPGEGNDVRLVFSEAKTFYNPELKTSGENNVANQIDYYVDLLSRCPNLIESYRCVAKTLVALCSMSNGHRHLSPLVHQVANGGRLTIDNLPQVNLVVFGFDADQRDNAWRRYQSALVEKLPRVKIIAAGAPRGIRLSD